MLAPQGRRTELALQADQAPISGWGRAELTAGIPPVPAPSTLQPQPSHQWHPAVFSSCFQFRSLMAIDVLLGVQAKRGPVTTPSERGTHRLQGWVPQTPCLCGGGRLFETSSAAFLICKIGAGIPYLAEVLRRLISICRTLHKTKHKAKQSKGLQPGREAAPGSEARPAPRQGLRHLSAAWMKSGSASHGGEHSEQGRRLRV